MAQNITLLGASYSDVPAVELPKTGGGTATFTDVTDTTATESDVAIGKYFYTASGVRKQETSSGGGGGGSIVVTDVTLPGGGIEKQITTVAASYQSKNVTPSESQQVITADTGYDAMDEVTVNAVSSSYVGSGITRRTSSDLSASGATVTVPSGYYDSQATKSVSNGTEGTPTATKGTVSNHSISVTPSVTNTGGYITGSTKTGTAVTVSASELVSGSQEITQNGTVDVTNLASVVVNVPTGSSKNIQTNMNRYETNQTAYTATSLSVTVSKAGTYDIYWSMDRNTTSGTNGSQVYVNNTAKGTAHTTFTHNGAACHESLTLAKNDVVVIRARARNTSYYCGVSNLVIIEQ